jgi:hypothetical protein
LKEVRSRVFFNDKCKITNLYLKSLVFSFFPASSN